MIEISILDFTLVNIVSYFSGIFTGVCLFVRYKDKIIIKSRSRDNLDTINYQNQMNTATQSSPPILASAPPFESSKNEIVIRSRE